MYTVCVMYGCAPYYKKENERKNRKQNKKNMWIVDERSAILVVNHSHTRRCAGFSPRSVNATKNQKECLWMITLEKHAGYSFRNEYLLISRHAYFVFVFYLLFIAIYVHIGWWTFVNVIWYLCCLHRFNNIKALRSHNLIKVRREKKIHIENR